MSKKLRIAAPLCGLLAVAVIALFCITGFAAGDEETKPQAVTVETMSAQGIEAPTKNLETLAPVQNVTQGDENPEEESDTVPPTGVSPYELTDEERMAVECAVMCEAGGEGSRGSGGV